MTDISNKCPAFEGGCPYASEEEMVAWLKQHRPDVLDKCPAFSEGCPFRGAQSIDELRRILQDLPESHTQAGSQHNVLVDMFSTLHHASAKVKESVGSDCPVFSTSCPFKTALCSSGVPLIDEIEYRSWAHLSADGLAADQHHTGRTPQRMDPGTPDLAVAKKLKEGTRVAHRQAENVHYVREFIKGRVRKESYKHMAAQLYFVYRTLEEVLDAHTDHPVVGRICFPDSLPRTRALERDLAFYWGPTWRQDIKPSPVANTYVQRLRDVSNHAPELIVPHAYTRYLGDLSGGQVLKRAAVKAMQLSEDGTGVAFYDFEDIPDMKAFKKMYRERLDSLPVDSATADRMVYEANYAFELNTHLFYELDVMAGFTSKDEVPKLAMRPVDDLIQSPFLRSRAASSDSTLDGRQGHGDDASRSKEDNDAVKRAAAAGCPFAAMAKAGVSMPHGHPLAASSEPGSIHAGGANAPSKGTSKCPVGNISPLDIAAILIIAAVILYFIPTVPPSGIPTQP